LRTRTTTSFELLGVGPDADRKAIREAYFTLSQRFHPDVWFGKHIGPWKPRMEAIFREVTKAYDVLSNRNHRVAYDASIGMKARTGSAANALAARSPATPPAAEPSTAQSTANSGAAPATALEPSAPPGATRPTSGSYRAQQQPGPTVSSHPPAATTGAYRAQPVIPPSTTPRDPNAPIIPDRNLRVTAQPMPPTNVTVRAPTIDPEAARRAARESLARKMGGSSTHISTGRLQAVRDPNAAPAPKSTDPTPTSSTMMSLQNARALRLDAERVAKLEHYLRLADESVRRNDLLGASNALQLALTISPEDATLRLRVEEAARKSAEIQAGKYIEQAREHEGHGNIDLAAEYWQRAAAGRPRDATVLVRAAMAVHRTKKDMQKAADLARRATLIAPRVETFALLVEIYLSAGMKASAHAAAEAAAKLDPASPVVKDLLLRAK